MKINIECQMPNVQNRFWTFFIRLISSEWDHYEQEFCESCQDIRDREEASRLTAALLENTRKREIDRERLRKAGRIDPDDL